MSRTPGREGERPPSKKLTGAGGQVEDNFVERLLAFNGGIRLKDELLKKKPKPQPRRAIAPVPSAGLAVASTSTATFGALKPFAFDKAKEKENVKIKILPKLDHIELRFELTEYVADLPDARFLNSPAVANNSRRLIIEKINVPSFEYACDRLEKISLFEYWKSSKTVLIAGKKVIVSPNCDVCGGFADRRNNKKVTCHLCHISVHQECYGLPYYPAANWKCRRCAIHPIHSIRCVFCPFEGGAMKFSSDNKAVHQLCAIWINGITVSQNSFLEPIDINTRDEVLNTERCTLCRNTYGAVLGCANLECSKQMHATCAALAGLTMETGVEVTGKPKPKPPPPPEEGKEKNYNRKIYCMNHSNLERHEKLDGIKRVNDAMENKSEYPIDLRSFPLDPKYLKPEYINSKLTEDEIGLIYRYWFVKRLRNFCSPQIPRLKAMYDRMIRPGRILKGELPTPDREEFTSRVSIIIGANGSLKIEANFMEDFPVLSGDMVNYLTNTLNDDHDNPSIDYDNQLLIYQKSVLHLNSIPIIDKEVAIIFCRSKEDIANITLEMVQKYVDPSMEFDGKVDYSFGDSINPWDIVGLMFYLAVPEHIQVAAFVSALWYLDGYGVFRTFNNNHPHAVNLRIMALKALHKQYPTIKHAYKDYFKMMKAVDSPAITKGRLQYALKFEETVCYLMIPDSQCHTLKLMVDEIDGEEQHRCRTLLRYLMHELTLSENIDEVAAALPIGNRGKLVSAAQYAKNLIILEKTEPVPNIYLLSKLYVRRKMSDKHAKVIARPSMGYTPMNGFRHELLFETMFANPFRFDTISWAEGNQMNEQRINKLGYDVKDVNGRPKVVNINSSRKRKNSDTPATKSAKIRKGEKEKKKKAPKIGDRIRVTRSGRPIGTVEPDEHQIRVRNESEKEDKHYLPTPSSSSFQHNTIVIVNKSVKGKSIAGRVIDPYQIYQINPSYYQRLLALPDSNKAKHVCVKLFLSEKKTKWYPESRISKMNLIEVRKFVNGKKSEIDHNSVLTTSITSAYKYYTEKLSV